MAVKKSAGGTRGQDESAAKTKAKAGGKKSAAKKEAAPKKSSTKVAAAAGAAPKKKAAAKKAAAPIKLTPTQSDLLRRIGESGETGYRSEKKAEQRTIDALSERKLIKRGAKDKASGNYQYLISNAGKKHLGAQQPAPSGEPQDTPPSGS